MTLDVFDGEAVLALGLTGGEKLSLELVDGDTVVAPEVGLVVDDGMAVDVVAVAAGAAVDVVVVAVVAVGFALAVGGVVVGVAVTAGVVERWTPPECQQI